jgi:hypothetical protein
VINAGSSEGAELDNANKLRSNVEIDSSWIDHGYLAFAIATDAEYSTDDADGY